VGASPSREQRSRARAELVLWCAALGSAVAGQAVTSGCAVLDETSPALSASSAADELRRHPVPDDSDPASLVPAGVKTVIDVDMAALRRSSWTSPALEARDPRARSAKAEALGYDDLADADRMIYAVTSAGPDAPTLVIVQGRVDQTRIEDAFRARRPGALVDRWRGVSVLARGEDAIAFLTGRTFTAGAPASVHAVIDRSFGIGPDVSADPGLGPTRRALCPEGRAARPSLLATITVDDRLRARAGDVGSVPRELRQVGLRVDVGQSLDVAALGILDDREAAAALERRLNDLMSDPATRLGLQALGLGVLLTQTRISLDGARVALRASIGDENRASLAAMLRGVVEASREGTGTGGLGSW